MKKLRYFVVSILLVCLSAALLLCACGEGSVRGGGLVMDKKYLLDASEEGRQNYYLFHADGTGEYACNYDFDTPYDLHYIVRFKYFYADKDESAVVCFFDSVEYAAGHQGAGVDSDTTYILTVSEHVLTRAQTCFINEDYIDRVPHYGT